MSRKILSINANKSMNFLLQTVSSSYDFELIPTVNMIEGITEIKRNKGVELVIVDLDFNTDENLDFISHITNSWLYRCPVMILTTNPAFVDHFSNQESCAVFLKPFSPSHLMETIDKMASTKPQLT